MLINTKDGVKDFVHVISDSAGYIQDGTVVSGGSTSIMIDSESDLATLTDSTPGTIAYTSGFKKLWQKSTDGTWVEV